LARRLGVDEGALIIKVAPESPAAVAGLQGTRRDQSGNLQLGDVIVAVDGKPIKNAKDLFSAISKHKTGDKVKLTIMRKGEEQHVELTLRALE